MEAYKAHPDNIEAYKGRLHRAIENNDAGFLREIQDNTWELSRSSCLRDQASAAARAAYMDSVLASHSPRQPDMGLDMSPFDGVRPGDRFGMGIAGSGPPPSDFEPFEGSRAGGGRLEDAPRNSGGSKPSSTEQFSNQLELEDAPRSSRSRFQ